MSTQSHTCRSHFPDKINVHQDLPPPSEQAAVPAQTPPAEEPIQTKPGDVAWRRDYEENRGDY